MQAENQGAGIQKTAAQFDHIRGTTQGKPESLLPIFFSLEVFDVKRKKKRRKKEKEEKRKGKKRGEKPTENLLHSKLRADK